MRYAYVIAASDSNLTGLTTQLESLGFRVEICPEQNLRDSQPLDLFRNGTVSAGGYLSLIDGRCNDFMLPSGGAVGCYLSHLKACELVGRHNDDDVCLVVEADCFVDLQVMRSILAEWEDVMLPSSPLPEVIFFGGKPLESRSSLGSQVTPNDTTLTLGAATILPVLPGAIISRTHCVLYTASGARKITKTLDRIPIEVQVDSMYSMLACLSGTSRLRLWWSPDGATQKLHASTIQDVCIPCLFRGGLLVVTCMFIVVAAFLIGVALGFRRSPSATSVLT